MYAEKWKDDFETLQKIPEDMLDKDGHLFRQGGSNILTTRVRTIHIREKFRLAVRDKVYIKTSSTHRELGDCAKKQQQRNKYQEHVWALIETLKSYKTSPIDSAPA